MVFQKQMVLNKVLVIGGLVTVSCLALLATKASAGECGSGGCNSPISTATENSYTTNNSANPQSTVVNASNPTGRATGYVSNTQIVFPTGGSSSFEGGAVLPGGVQVKGSVTCGNDVYNVAFFPGVTDGVWSMMGGFSATFTNNKVNCPSQQALIECAQRFALGDSGENYAEECGKKFTFARVTTVNPTPQAVVVPPKNPSIIQEEPKKPTKEVPPQVPPEVHQKF